MSNIQYDKTELEKRFLILRTVVVITFLILAVSLAFFQIIQRSEYAKLASQNRLRILRIIPPRGVIYDANGEYLAVNVRTFSISGYPIDLRDPDKLKLVISILKRGGIPSTEKEIKEKVQKQYSAPYRAITIATNLTFAQASQLVMDKNFSDLLTLTPVWKRSYPAGADAAHAVGYIAEITKEELENHPEYQGGDLIGKTGVELCYEEQLRGIPGEKVIEIDSRGRLLRQISYTPSVKGGDIKLSIDLGAHKYARKLLGNFRGAIVALDVRDGSVVCIASSPSYNPNTLVWGITSAEWAELLDNNKRPMMNRAISGAYPPASTFKVVTASAGLSSGTITTGTSFTCPGYYELGKRKFRCWKHDGHGSETVVKALRDSCDVFFYNTSWNMGIDKLIATASKFGVGKKTGIDLPSESAGTLAGPKWKKKKIKENWYGGDTVNYSIGQGYLLMTPLQVARVYVAIANGGKLFRPRVNLALPVEYDEINLSSDIIRTLRQGLVEVGSIGTGRAASEYGVNVAGKTGTAQNSHGDDHAWFAGYAPVNKPRYVVVAIAEAGKGGGAITGPMVGKMLNYLINHKGELMFNDTDLDEPKLNTQSQSTTAEDTNNRQSTDVRKRNSNINSNHDLGSNVNAKAAKNQNNKDTKMKNNDRKQNMAKQQTMETGTEKTSKTQDADVQNKNGGQ